MNQRLKWAAVGALALLVTWAGAYRWPVSSAYVAAELNRELSQSVGLELRGPARAYLTLFPSPNVQLTDVELRGRDGETVLTAPHAHARLALASLLTGRFRFTRIILRQPTALVDLDQEPFAKSSALARLIDSKSEADSRALLGELHVSRGLLHIVSAAHGLDTLLEDVDGDFEWPRFVDPLRLSLHATWRGGPVKIAGSLDTPVAWLAGERSKGALELVSSGASLTADGALRATDAGGGFEGALSAKIGSLSGFARLAGLAQASALPDGRMSIAGKATADLQSLTLSDMRFQVLEQTFDGGLALVRTQGRLSISGSLAAEAVKLDDLLTNASLPVDQIGEWSRTPFSANPFGGLALDLRASAGKVEWRGHAVQDVAFSLMSANGGATATLSEATAYKGMLKGEVSFAPGPEGLQVRASGGLAKADFGALVADLGSGAYSGEGSGRFALEATGDSPDALMRAISGEASIELGAGVIDGLSFEEALRRSERHPLNLFADMRTGRTVFNQASAQLTIEKGEARLSNAAMTGPGVCVTLSGGADLVKQELSARLTANRADQQGAANPNGPRLNLTIIGPWSRPIIKSDTGA